jgi:CheY-like chemotaxis protein
MSMRGSPFSPHFAHSGSDGLQRARALRPAAILLDCVLPDLSGVEVCRQLSVDERTRSIPVLLITARSATARDEFREFPSVVDFVGKPFTGPDLLIRIGAPSERRRAPAQAFSRDQQERAARIITASFATVPAVRHELARLQPAGPYFAKRPPAPDIVDSLLGGSSGSTRGRCPPPPPRPRGLRSPDVVRPWRRPPCSIAPPLQQPRAPRQLLASARRAVLIDAAAPLLARRRAPGPDRRIAARCGPPPARVTRTRGPEPAARPVVILEPDVQASRARFRPAREPARQSP